MRLTSLNRSSLPLLPGRESYVGPLAPPSLIASLPTPFITLNAHLKWCTPGLVDMHSHAGIGSLPGLEGTEGDVNSLRGEVGPGLRGVDGISVSTSPSTPLSQELASPGGPERVMQVADVRCRTAI